MANMLIKGLRGMLGRPEPLGGKLNPARPPGVGVLGRQKRGWTQIRDAGRVGWVAGVTARRNAVMPREWSGWLADQLRLGNGASIRQALRAMLQTQGLSTLDARLENKQGNLEYKVVEGLKSAGLHAWSGEVSLDPKTHALAIWNLDDLAAGRTSGGRSWFGLRALVHEEIHGLSGTGSRSYRGVGAWIEEAVTETLAQRVMRTALNVTTDPFDVSYRREIEGMIDVIKREIGVTHQEAYGVLENAAQIFKSVKRKPQESTNEEAARDFSFCFGNIGERARKRLVTAMLDAGRDWDTRHSAQAALKQIDGAR